MLASYVLSRVALAEGYDVKQSEVHGMAQRGGCVTSHLRFGDQVYSSLITPGTVDVLLSFESVEAMRYVHWLKPGGLLVYNAARVNPSTVSSGAEEYPEGIDERIAAAWPNVRAVDASALAAKAGTVKAANVVMLGAMASALPFTPEMLESVIRRSVSAEDPRREPRGLPPRPRGRGGAGLRHSAANLVELVEPVESADCERT